MKRRWVWKPPQVEVEWVDACGYDELNGTKGAVLDRAKLRVRQTAGFLIHQDGPEVASEILRRTVLAHDYDPPVDASEEPAVGNITVVPTAWVMKIRYKSRKESVKKAKPSAEAESSGAL